MKPPIAGRATRLQDPGPEAHLVKIDYLMSYWAMPLATYIESLKLFIHTF